MRAGGKEREEKRRGRKEKGGSQLPTREEDRGGGREKESEKIKLKQEHGKHSSIQSEGMICCE